MQLSRDTKEFSFAGHVTSHVDARLYRTRRYGNEDVSQQSTENVTDTVTALTSGSDKDRHPVSAYVATGIATKHRFAFHDDKCVNRVVCDALYYNSPPAMRRLNSNTTTSFPSTSGKGRPSSVTNHDVYLYRVEVLVEQRHVQRRVQNLMLHGGARSFHVDDAKKWCHDISPTTTCCNTSQ